MGLLRKLAGLVVEFPEEETAGQATGSQEDDVVAAIEKIRLDLEQTDTTGFSADDTTPAESGSAAPAGAPAASVTGLAPAATRHIPLPRFLAIQEIYDQAKIPASKISIYRVEEMLDDPEISDLEPAMRARMVKMTLKNLDIELSDILTDAGYRDKSLEAYQKFLEEIIEGIADQIQNTNNEIQLEIDSFINRHQAVINQNNGKLKLLHDSLAEFMRSKEVEEQRLFNIAAPFVEEGQNPVDVGDQPAE